MIIIQVILLLDVMHIPRIDHVGSKHIIVNTSTNVLKTRRPIQNHYQILI